ncbi:MAG: type II toxin-antitoxin system RelE/ParE family toxin [Sphingobacteriaceae bacterium]|nr:MAG: type II toxin-antitoxin system RelE/ParE family toxin [Sphingobacteriaceae bacterium]
METKWTEEAEVTFDAIYSFIENNWNSIVAEDFRYKVQELLATLFARPLTFPETNIPNIRKAAITKQTFLFYEVEESRVILLFFWDKVQKPLL